MESPKFYQDGPLDITQINQCLNSQTILINQEIESLKKELKEVRQDVQKLSKNIDKLVDVLIQSNPRAKNIMIRSYSTSGVITPFIKEPREKLK
jgi:wobble nucleotide-excising tRNase